MLMFQTLLLFALISAFTSVGCVSIQPIQLPRIHANGPLVIDVVVVNQPGLDMLLFRMLELHAEVDYFVLIESNNTKNTSLYDKNSSNFQAYAHQVIAVTVDVSTPQQHFDAVTPILQKLHGLSADDIIFISQVEEIPRPSLIHTLKMGGVDMPYRLSLKHFTYSLVCVHDPEWRFAFVSDYKSLVALLLLEYPATPAGVDHGASEREIEGTLVSPSAVSLFSIRQGTTPDGDRIPRSLVKAGWFFSKFGDIEYFATAADLQARQILKLNNHWQGQGEEQNRNTARVLAGDISREHCLPYPTYYSELPIHVEVLLQNGWGDCTQEKLISVAALNNADSIPPVPLSELTGVPLSTFSSSVVKKVLLSVFPRTARLIIDCILYPASDASAPRPSVHILLFRLAELYDIVDYFIIIDSAASVKGEVGHRDDNERSDTGWVTQWKEELKSFWDKIIYVPVEYGVGTGVKRNTTTWLDRPLALTQREHEVVRMGVDRVHGLRFDDLVMVSRVDEVPSFRALNTARLNGLGSGLEGSVRGSAEHGYRLSMRYFYGHLNCRISADARFGLNSSADMWERAVIMHYFTFERWIKDPLSVTFMTQPNGGWYLREFACDHAHSHARVHVHVNTTDSLFHECSRVPAEMMGLCTNDFDSTDAHALPRQLEQMITNGWLKDQNSIFHRQMRLVSNHYLRDQTVKPLYYFGDEGYLQMKDYFVNSIVDYDLEHHFHLLSQSSAIPTDSSKMTGADTWIFKNRFILDAIRSNMGKIILFSDIDMQYFQPVTPLVDACMRNKEMCFQRETLHYGFINTGFMAILCNDRTLTFWNKVLEILLVTRRQKQGIVHDLLYFLKYDIRWGVFPASVWSWHFTPLHHDLAVHHASFVVGKENKFDQLRYVRLYMQYAPTREQRNNESTVMMAALTKVGVMVERHVYVL